MLIEHMKQPAPYETFGTVAGVARSTLYEWEEMYPEFSDAKKVGREWQYLNLYKLGLAGMTGQLTTVRKETTVKKKNGDVETTKEYAHVFGQAAWIFMMKNMQSWKDEPDTSEDDWVDEITFGGKPALGVKSG
jgi:hypothetical protein